MSAPAQPKKAPATGSRRRRRLPAFAAASLAIGTVIGAPGAWAQTAGSSAGSGSSAATAATTTPTSGTSLRQEAASLAARIRQQSRQADQLAEQADRAQIQVAQIADQLQGAQVALTGTSAKLSSATVTLAHQAVAAYTQGGRQPLTYVVGDTADDRSLINGYASTLAGIQQRDVDTYKLLRRQQSDQAQALSVAKSSAVASVEQLRAAQRAAQTVAAEEQRTLDNIQAQPQLTTLVASAQTSQYQATAVAVQARFASGGTATGAGSTSRSGGSATSGSATGRVAGPASATPAYASPIAVPSRSTSSGSGPIPSPVTRAPVTTTAAQPVVTTAPSAPSAPPSGVSAAIAYAYAQIGKPYLWGGAGPGSFDCSGLVMRAYETAGINFDHSAQDQYNATARVSINALRPGDLVFFGTSGNVYHVGIYVGGGSMVDAPHTGANVRVEGIYWSDLLAGGRV